MSIQPVFRPVGTFRQPLSRRWALSLVVAFVLQTMTEFLSIRFTVDAEGHWAVVSAEDVPVWLLVLSLAIWGGSLVAAIGFAAALIRERRGAVQPWPFPRGVTGTDVLYVLAGMQALLAAGQLVYVALPEQLFAEGTMGNLLESSLLQLAILAVTAVGFRGRWADIGFVAPKSPGRMLLFLLLGAGFIFFAMDVLITYPLSDWLNLSLDSERELNIQEEIERARDNDWRAALAAVVMIGAVAPISEEMLFRGVIQTYLVKRWGAFWGIIVTSFCFALIHVDVALFVPLFVIGVLLGLIRHRYQSIWGAVLLHSVNNLASVLSHFF